MAKLITAISDSILNIGNRIILFFTDLVLLILRGVSTFCKRLIEALANFVMQLLTIIVKLATMPFTFVYSLIWGIDRPQSLRQSGK